MSDLIKVHVTYDDPEGPRGEWLWAKRISDDTAKIDNVPFFTTDFSLGSLVKFDKGHEIVEVLETGPRTKWGKYDGEGTQNEIKEKYTKIRKVLESHDIIIEGMGAGIFSMAVPADMDDEQLEGVLIASGAEVIK